jgi:hypothetical protein
VCLLIFKVWKKARYGHEGADGVEDLRVCLGEITADVAAAKSEVLEFSPPLPGNFRKADTQNAGSSGDFRHIGDLQLPGVNWSLNLLHVNILWIR